MNSFKIKNSMDSNWEGVSKNVQKLCIEMLKRGPIPQHVAFIMDGNRRFAKKLGVPTNIGHSLGFSSLEKVY
jgi:ditrans,polycis-polyprenyl diphosphate synthase